MSCLTSHAINTGGTVYNYLTLPSSAVLSGLGGANVSLPNGDVQMATANPALLGLSSDKDIALTYVNYIEDVQYGNLMYGQAIDSTSWFGVGFSYLNYGDFESYDIYDQQQGTFSAADMNLSLIYARRLAKHLVAGLSLKPVYSYIEDYNSFGLALDLGANYYLPEKNFSAGLAVRNFGVQFTAYDENKETLPWDIQAGISKKLEHAPFRFSLTYVKLNKWNLDYVKENSLYEASSDNVESTYKKDVAWGNMLMRHIIIGVELIPSNNFSLMVAYNHRRRAEFSMENLSSASGFSFGGNLHVYKFNLGVSYAVYGPSGGVFGLSLSSSLSDFKKK